MSHLPQSEWILAGRFVDHELSDAEAARAEARVASDPQFAAAVEELRYQKNIFDGLPKFTPAEDLKERTLQASLDQVKAIMGAWPIEEANEAANELGGNHAAATTNSVDWKSTAALVASLAGVVIIGSMLWPGQSGRGDGGVAMESTTAQTDQAMPIAEDGADEESGHFEFNAEKSQSVPSRSLKRNSASGIAKKERAVVPPTLVRPNEMPLDPAAERAGKGGMGQQAAALDSPFNSPEMAEAPAQLARARRNKPQPEFGAMVGTPMKFAGPASTLRQQELANATAPLDQIWCIHQDQNVSRETVSQILNLNEIKVQREQPPNSVYATKEPVEAFYVAATEQQMMLAMSQISNNADVEMIQLPAAGDSLIADAIAKQFAGVGNNPVADDFPDAQSADDDSEAESAPAELAEAPAQHRQQGQAIAPGFRKPKTQALAQQLFANSIPRNFEPSGPVPPILRSSDLADMDSLEMGFREPSKDDRAGEQASISKSAASTDQLAAPQAQRESQLPTKAFETLSKESEIQLRQYLILVRGGEGTGR